MRVTRSSTIGRELPVPARMPARLKQASGAYLTGIGAACATLPAVCRGRLGGRCLAFWAWPALVRSGNGTVWHLIEDFFEQGIVVKLFLGVGWLAVVIMVASFLALLFQ